MEFYTTLAQEGFVVLADNFQDDCEFPLIGLHIEITFACNERCIHCYLPNAEKDTGVFMSPDLFYKLIDEFCELGGTQVTVSGGEPLLHPNFKDFVKYCNDKGLTLSIFSNLLLCDDSMADYLKSVKIDTVQTSVYSLDPHTHDAVTNVTGSLARTLSAIDRLKSSGINISISCPIMSINESGAEQIILYAQKNKFSLRLDPMIVAKSDGDTGFVANGRLSIEQHRNFLKRLMNFDRDYVKENLLEIDFNSENKLINNTEAYLNGNICSAGVDHLCFSSKGYAYPCAGWESFRVGNINTERLSEIWFKSPELKRVRDANKRSKHLDCLVCPTLRYCKRCLMQNALEGSFGKFNKRCCDDARIRCDVLSNK
ncbi:MAG: radical SAM protein [Duncaniella sp.]|nr:radical SAM protein [Duncaniella sp.]